MDLIQQLLKRRLNPFPSGRRRKWSSAAKITELLNSPVQGTSADITKKALSLLPQRLADTGARIIGTVHDEIILEVPDEKANDAAAILEKTMIETGKAYLSAGPLRWRLPMERHGQRSRQNRSMGMNCDHLNPISPVLSTVFRSRPTRCPTVATAEIHIVRS